MFFVDQHKGNTEITVDYDSVPDLWININWNDDALVQRNIYAGTYRAGLSFLKKMTTS